MTMRFRAHLAPGVSAPPPARKYPARSNRPNQPAGGLDELRGRVAAHVDRPSAMIIWNGAVHAAIERFINEQEVTKERAIEILMKLQADVF